MATTLRGSCFKADPGFTSFEDARRIARDLARPHGRIERAPLALAAGRIAARPALAPCDLPMFDQAAMDGYAVLIDKNDDAPGILPVTGRTDAGDPPGALGRGEAYLVMTGAALPRGANAVVMQEHAHRSGDRLQVDCAVAPEDHIRRAGEDVARGSVVVPAGRAIGWPEIALLAALGVSDVQVAAQIRLAVLTTGSELHPASGDPPPGGVRDSNGPMLSALLADANVRIDAATVADDRDAIASALSGFARDCDLVVTTAGMSLGERDHVRDAVAQAGGRLDVGKVAMKPGKPLALGRIGGACFIGLPGNPQAAAFGALIFIRPMIAALLGVADAPRFTAETDFAFNVTEDRTELIPVRLANESGRVIASRCGPVGSHRLMPMAAADAIAIAPPRIKAAAGALIEILPFGRPRFAAGTP